MPDKKNRTVGEASELNSRAVGFLSDPKVSEDSKNQFKAKASELTVIMQEEVRAEIKNIVISNRAEAMLKELEAILAKAEPPKN